MIFACPCLNIKVHANSKRNGAADPAHVEGARESQLVQQSGDEGGATHIVRSYNASSRRGACTIVQLGIGGLIVEHPALLAVVREPDQECSTSDIRNPPVSLRCLNCGFTACSFVPKTGTDFAETTCELVKTPIPTTLAPQDGFVYIMPGALADEEVEVAKRSPGYSPAFRVILESSSLVMAPTNGDAKLNGLRPEYVQACQSIAYSLSAFLAADARTTEEDIARYREQKLADLQQRRQKAVHQQHILWDKIREAHAGELYEDARFEEASRIEKGSVEKSEAAKQANGTAKTPQQEHFAVAGKAATSFSSGKPNAVLERPIEAASAASQKATETKVSNDLPASSPITAAFANRTCRSGEAQLARDSSVDIFQPDRVNGQIRIFQEELNGNINDEGGLLESEGSEENEDESDAEDASQHPGANNQEHSKVDDARYGKSAPIDIVFPHYKPRDACPSEVGAGRILGSMLEQPVSTRAVLVSGRRHSFSPGTRLRDHGLGTGEGLATFPPLTTAAKRQSPNGDPGSRARGRRGTAPFIAPHILAEKEEEDMKNSLFLGSVPRNARSHY